MVLLGVAEKKGGRSVGREVEIEGVPVDGGLRSWEEEVSSGKRGRMEVEGGSER